MDPPGLSTLVAEIYGPDYERQREIAKEVMNIFEETPEVVDTDWYMEDRQTRINLVVDKEKAALHGISASISGTGMFFVIPRIFLGLLNFFLECFIRPGSPRPHSKGGNDNQKTRQRPDTGHD